MQVQQKTMSEDILTPNAVFEWEQDYQPASEGDTVEVVKLYQKDGTDVAEVVNYRDEHEVVKQSKIINKVESGLLSKVN